MRKILVTGIGGDVACSIIRCLLDSDKESPIYGIDVKKYTPYMDMLAGTFTVPAYTDEAYLPFVKKLIERYGITHFIPTTEYEIKLFDKERAYFREQNIKLLVNNEKIIDICTSKYRTAEFLRHNYIDAPLTFLAEEYDGELNYPFILKADKGCGSKGLQIIHNTAEWKICNKTGMVCQQMVGNPDSEYTVGVFSDGNIVNSITFKRRLGFGGLSAFVEVCDISGINRIADNAAKIFKLQGSFNIQLRENDGRYYIFEINPRISSTAGFRHKLGFCDVVWWFDMLDGEKISLFKNGSIGKIGVKVLEDIILESHAGQGILEWGGL